MDLVPAVSQALRLEDKALETRLLENYSVTVWLLKHSKERQSAGTHFKAVLWCNLEPIR